jgi:hypothetical protein
MHKFAFVFLWSVSRFIAYYVCVSSPGPLSIWSIDYQTKLQIAVARRAYLESIRAPSGEYFCQPRKLGLRSVSRPSLSSYCPCYDVTYLSDLRTSTPSPLTEIYQPFCAVHRVSANSEVTQFSSAWDVRFASRDVLVPKRRPIWAALWQSAPAGTVKGKAVGS